MSSSRLNQAQRSAVAELLRVSPIADELGRRFAAAGHELHLVGGSVRDALLDRNVDDLDFTTDARPPEIREIVEGVADSVFGVGEAYGTVGARFGEVVYEITTFRSEVYRDAFDESQRGRQAVGG